jgi:N-acetyltransferase
LASKHLQLDPQIRAMTSPDLQPTLTGARVIARPLIESDWAALFSAASDPEIWAGHPAKDRYTEPGFRLFFDGALESGAAFVFIERATGRVIGSSRYFGWDPGAREIEIGWSFLAREFWGGSYNAEVKRLMLDHAFTFADCVIFWVGEDNIRSQKAMAKIGGQRRSGLVSRDLGSGPLNHILFEIRKAASA